MGIFISCTHVGVPLGPFPSFPGLRVREQSKQMQPHPSTLLNSVLAKWATVVDHLACQQ